MIIRELITKIGFNADAQKLNNFMGGVTKLGVGLAAVTAAAYGLKKIFDITFGAALQVSDDVQDIVKMSAAIGVTTDELQRLRYAADMADVTYQELTSGIRIFSRNLQEAKDGTEQYVEDFKKLFGKDVDPKSITNTSEALLMVSERLQKLPNDAEKTAMMLRTFGRGGAAMIPFLNMGPEQISEFMDEMKGAYSQSLIDIVEGFDVAQKQMKNGFHAIKIVMAEELLPVLRHFVDRIKEIGKESGKYFTNFTRDASKLFARVAKWVGDLIFDFVQIAGPGIMTMLSSIAQAIGTILNALNQIVGIKLPTDKVSSLKDTFQALFWVVNKTAILIAIIITGLEFLLVLIVAIGKDIDNFITGKPSEIGEAFKKMIQGAYDFGYKMGEKLANRIIEDIARIKTAIGDLFKIQLPSWLGGGMINPLMPFPIDLNKFKSGQGGLDAAATQSSKSVITNNVNVTVEGGASSGSAADKQMGETIANEVKKEIAWMMRSTANAVRTGFA